MGVDQGLVVAGLELAVREGDWRAGRNLKDPSLPREGVLALGVQRSDGRIVGTLRGKTWFKPPEVKEAMHGKDAGACRKCHYGGDAVKKLRCGDCHGGS